MRNIITFLSIFLLISLFNLNVSAQEESIDVSDIETTERLQLEEFISTDPFDSLTDEQKAGIEFCSFDTSYGLINVDISSEISEFVAGTDVTFAGTIDNLSDTSIVNGTLYVRILKIGEEDYVPNVVDQFIAQDNITIQGNDSIPVSVNWNIPSVLEDGDYRLATYFYTDNKIDVSGILNSPSSFEKFFDFSVLNEEGLNAVRFEPAALGVNLEVYTFGADPFNVPRSGEVLITVPAFNMSEESQNVMVEWKVYKNDRRNPDNLIKVFNTDASVPAQSSYEFALELKESEYAMYHVVGELKDRDSKSFVEVVYVREGIPAVSIHSNSIESYPLVRGEENKISTCIYGVGPDSIINDGKVLLELKNSRGRVIEKYLYEGPITSRLMLVSKDFTSRMNLNSFTLSTKIFEGENIVNEFERSYDCKILDPENCNDNVLSKIVYVIGGILLLSIILLLMKKIRKHKNIMLPLFVFILLLITPLTGEAKSVSSSQTISSMTTGGWPSYTLGNVRMNVTYSADIKNATTNTAIKDGASVPEGTQLKFTFSSNNSISWQATSPKWMYGLNNEWGSGAPSSACSGSYTDRDDLGGLTSNVTGVLVNTNRTIYTYLKSVINVPSKTISKSGNLSCGSLSGNTMTCTVTGPGPISVDFNFSGTSGRLYRSTKDTHTQSGFYIQGTQQDSTCRGPYQFSPNFSLPSATISYNFTAGPVVPPNNPPAAPVITGPTTGQKSTPYTFGFRAVDPDEGDKIRYGVSWDNDNTVDEWIPASGYVNSGVLRNGDKAWGANGTKTFKARTQDQAGLNSGWTSYSITLADLPVNGSCGTTNNSCLAGTSVNTADSSTNYQWQCNGIGGGSNASCSLPMPPAPVNGSCGTTNNSCTAGTLFDIADSGGNSLWRCRGTNGGTVASCSIPQTTTGGSSFSVSCSASQILPGSQATFTATPQNNSGSVTYQWKEANGSNISGANNSTFRRTYNSIGSYMLRIYATSTGNGANNFCYVTVGCDNTYTEGQIETACSNNTERVWSCGGSGWTTVSRSCVSEDEPTGTFEFNPGIVTSVNGRCSINIDADNVSSCRLIKSGITFSTTPSINSYLSGTSININGGISVPIGRYTLECTGTGPSPSVETFETRSCILNPDIREY